MKNTSTSGFQINVANTTQYGVRNYSKTVSFSNSSLQTMMTLTAGSGATTGFTIAMWYEFFGTAMNSGATYQYSPQTTHYGVIYILNSSNVFVQDSILAQWGVGNSQQSFNIDYNGTAKTIKFQTTSNNSAYYPQTGTINLQVVCSDWSLLTVS
jgi:hypothetical protein